MRAYAPGMFLSDPLGALKFYCGEIWLWSEWCYGNADRKKKYTMKQREQKNPNIHSDGFRRFVSFFLSWFVSMCGLWNAR